MPFRWLVLGIVLVLGASFASFEYFREQESKNSEPPSSMPAQVHRSLSRDWKLIPLNGGDTVPLSSFKGKVVFLNIWATWCGPCVQEMPTIEVLFNSFVGQHDIAFVLVSLDRDAEEVKRFLQEMHYAMPVYMPLDDPPEELKTRGIPATFIIDQDQKLRYKEVGKRDWSDASVRGMLKGLLEAKSDASADSTAK